MKVKIIVRNFFGISFGVIFLIICFDYLGYTFFLITNGEINHALSYGVIAVVSGLFSAAFFRLVWKGNG